MYYVPTSILFLFSNSKGLLKLIIGSSILGNELIKRLCIYKYNLCTSNEVFLPICCEIKNKYTTEVKERFPFHGKLIIQTIS